MNTWDAAFIASLAAITLAFWLLLTRRRAAGYTLMICAVIAALITAGASIAQLERQCADAGGALKDRACVDALVVDYLEQR